MSPRRLPSGRPRAARGAAGFALLTLAACLPAGGPTDDGGALPDGSTHEDGGGTLDAGPAPDGNTDACPDLGARSLAGDDGERVVVTVAPGCDATLTVSMATDALVEVSAAGATLSLDDTGEDELGWIATRRWAAGDHALRVSPLQATDDEPITVTLASHGRPTDAVLIERSLVWTDPALVDDAAAVGLGRLLAVIADDGHGGRLLAQWLTRFSTTAHSERAGPTLLLEELQDLHGADASTWDLDALPFVVTAVHNRLDLRDDASCGELRVSLASLHDVWRPLHLIFLFTQPPTSGDVSPAGTVHCHATARRWARLSALPPDAFLLEARALLDEGLAPERFLLAESEELTVSPWEWRQWSLVDNPVVSARDELPRVFENVPLFQTVDIPAVNAPGPLRTAFLTFVGENAPALAARRQLIPAAFRPLSVRVNSGVPWTPLDLSGVDEDVLATYPRLRQHIETVGCAGCHTAGEFVQTREDRSFAVFYDSELLARRDHLTSLQAGALDERPPFGALQADPPLTP